jgi:hypothetical protein
MAYHHNWRFSHHMSKPARQQRCDVKLVLSIHPVYANMGLTSHHAGKDMENMAALLAGATVTHHMI